MAQSDHLEPVHIGIGHLGRDQAAMVEMLLHSENVGHEMVGDEIVVVRRHEPAARRIVRTVEQRATTFPAWFDPMPEPETKVAGIPVARRLLRFAGWAIDMIVLQVIGTVAVLLGASTLAVLAIGALYTVGFTATTGRTIGKALLGTRVVARGGGRVGIVSATLRWGVASVGAVAASLITRDDPTSGATAAAAAVLVAWPLLDAAALIHDLPLRRAWHDRVARTVVVLERRRAPRPA